MLIKLIVISLAYITVDGANLKNGKPYYDIELAETHFLDFLEAHNKTYNGAEFKKRFDIFYKTLHEINRLNDKHEFATFEVNFLADITHEEREAMGCVKLPNESLETAPVDDFEGVEIPDSVDWRTSNGVTPVKNQGQCGSCWAFSAVGTIESQVAIKHKKQLDLSEQQIVDCDRSDYGCHGGFPVQAFEYAANTGGVMMESSYRYTGRDGRCSFNQRNVGVRVWRGRQLEQLSEEDMAKYIATYGPVSVCLHMSNELNHYRSGVVAPRDCNGQPNHALVAVGYGTENGVPYWLIKNSWGTRWGDAGYLKLARGRGLCQINNYVSIVDIE